MTKTILRRIDASVARKLLARIDEVLLGIVFIPMLCFGLSSIFFRFILRSPLPWPDEANRLLLIWLTLLGALVATRQGSHLRLEASVLGLLPPGARMAVETVLDLLVICLLVVLAYSGAQFALAVTGSYLITLRSVSLTWFVAAVPIVGTAMAIVLGVKRIKTIREFRARDRG